MIRDLDIRINPDLAPSEYDPSYILSLILDIGEEMLTCGAEINRVEESIYRALTSYGFRKVNVFAIPEYVSVSFLDLDGEITSQSRRVYRFGNDYTRLEGLNDLCRYICTAKPTVREIWERLENIKPVSYHKNMLLTALAYAAAGGGFSVFFGGDAIDGLVACITAFLIMFSSRFSRVQNMNKVVYTTLAAMLGGFFATFCYIMGFGHNLDKILIGDIMLLIPGMALTNGFRDMLCGDIIAGLLRFTESILIAGAIAIGYAIPLFLLGSYI